jgi:hypothetical protein
VAVGKPKKLALTAVMRKLTFILNAILRDRQPWHTPFSAGPSKRVADTFSSAR